MKTTKPASVNLVELAPMPGEKITEHPWRENGLGCWGDKCATLETPMCALPHEDWEEKFGTGAAARGQKVKVTFTPDKGEAKTVECELRDSLPHRANCFNCGIALNPAALKALGIKSATASVSWEWS